MLPDKTIIDAFDTKKAVAWTHGSSGWYIACIMIIPVIMIIMVFNVMVLKLIRGLFCMVFSQKTNSSQCQHVRFPTEHDDREEGTDSHFFRL